MKNITIKEISKIAGVSTATVSRFINNKTNKMSLKTKEKLEKIIKENGYQPNEIARSLVKNYSKSIGVCIADIKNPFSSIMIEAISNVCDKKGYKLLFSNSSNNPSIEREAINNFISYRVDGIIINTTGENEEFIRDINFKNLMIIDRPLNSLIIDTVTSNNYESTKEILEYMHSLNYTNIFFVTLGLDNISTRKIRFDSFKDTMKNKYNLSLKETEKNHINISKKEDIKNLLNIIKNNNKKIAFFTVNGDTLIALLKILKNNNIKINENLGIASHEYWEYFDLFEPKITVVNQNSYQMGEICATKLIEKIESKNLSQHEKIEIIKVKSNIIKGESIK